MIHREPCRPADNPFRSSRIEALDPRFPEGRPDLLAGLRRLGGRGLLVGGPGRGKTTLLRSLGGRLEQAGYRVVAIDSFTAVSEIPAPEPRDAILVEGVDRAGLLRWLRLRSRIRSAGRVVGTSHRPGRLPILHRCESSPPLFAELVGELLGAESGGEGRLRTITDPVFHRVRGDLRRGLRELYDRWSRGDPTVTALGRRRT